MPEVFVYLWNMFREIDLSRQLSEIGPQALLNSEILAWCVLTSNHLSAWEIDAIRALDGVALRHFAKQQKARLKEAQERARARQPHR